MFILQLICVLSSAKTAAVLSSFCPDKHRTLPYSVKPCEEGWVPFSWPGLCTSRALWLFLKMAGNLRSEILYETYLLFYFK